MHRENIRIDRTPRELLYLKIDPGILIDYHEDILKKHPDNVGINWLEYSSTHLQLAIDYIKAFNKEIEILRREVSDKIRPPYKNNFEERVYNQLAGMQPGEEIIFKNHGSDNTKKIVSLIKKYMHYHTDSNTIPFQDSIELVNGEVGVRKMEL
ncbi:MAG: hypothetical protein ABFS35_21495 [Bacteroidota bacterium]